MSCINFSRIAMLPYTMPCHVRVNSVFMFLRIYVVNGAECIQRTKFTGVSMSPVKEYKQPRIVEKLPLSVQCQEVVPLLSHRVDNSLIHSICQSSISWVPQQHHIHTHPLRSDQLCRHNSLYVSIGVKS